MWWNFVVIIGFLVDSTNCLVEVQITDPQVVIGGNLDGKQNVTLFCEKSDGTQYQHCSWRGPNMQTSCTLRQECQDRAVRLSDDGRTCSVTIELKFNQDLMLQNLGKWTCLLADNLDGNAVHVIKGSTTLHFVDNASPKLSRKDQEKHLMPFTPKEFSAEIDVVTFECSMQFPAPINKLIWLKDGVIQGDQELYTIDNLVWENQHCNYVRKWPIINSTKSFTISRNDFGSRISCRVEKLHVDNSPLFARGFETLYALKMAIEPFVLNVSSNTANVTVDIEIYPPMSSIQIESFCDGNKACGKNLFDCEISNFESFICHGFNQSRVAVSRLKSYVYQVSIPKYNVHPFAETLNVNAVNSFGASSKTFLASEFRLPNSSSALEQRSSYERVVLGFIIGISLLIVLLTILGVYLICKFRTNIIERFMCGEYLVVEDEVKEVVDPEEIVVTAPDEVKENIIL